MHGPALQLFNEMSNAIAKARSQQATAADVSTALIAILASTCGATCGSESQQDKYMEWIVSGVENCLKRVGVRKTARPNPLAIDKDTRAS